MVLTESHPTSKPSSKSVVEGLHLLLAESYSLMAQTHFAHWNVEGTDFFQLHDAFEQQYTELFAAIDEIAERIRALGAYSPGGLRTLADLAQMEEMEAPQSGKDFVACLVVAHEQLLQDARALRAAAGSAGDPETEDLVIGRIQVHEKTVWMLKSYLK